MDRISNCLCRLCLVLVCGCGRPAPPAPPEEPQPAPVTDEEVRRAVAEGGVGLALPVEGPYAMIEVVVVPSKIQAAYQQRPDDVVALLFGIAERGRPEESVRALAYAWALVDHPGMPAPAVRLFDENTYDRPDPDWGRTPREHWLRVLKQEIDAAKRKK